MTSNARCAQCSQRKYCSATSASWVFFIIGLVAAFAVRLVVVFMNFNMLYARIAWYVGVLGFLVFFLYKFNIDRTRSRLLEQHGLVEKMDRREPLSKEEYSLVGSILCSLRSKKDRINYFIIFSTSVVVILFALYQDFLK